MAAYENKYKELPYTIELDWKTGNTLLNIPIIDCKLVVTPKDAKSIASCILMGMNRDELRKANPLSRKVTEGKFYRGLDDKVYRVLDVTSEEYALATASDEDALSKINMNFFEIDYARLCVYSELAKKTHVFLKNYDTNLLIKGVFVVYADVSSPTPEIQAMPIATFNEFKYDGTQWFTEVKEIGHGEDYHFEEVK